jgi:tetratricopeptide (TPR) repeat protein
MSDVSPLTYPSISRDMVCCAARGHTNAQPRNREKHERGQRRKRMASKEKKRQGPNGSRGRVMSKIEKLVATKKWTVARAAIQAELLSSPTDHWLWTTLGLTYYEQRQYEKALSCSRRAVELAPSCPLVLWDFAGCLYMNGQDSAALTIWTLLLSMDVDEVANGEDGEGLDWAMQLLNDVHYRMGKYYMRKGEYENAKASFMKYVNNRAHGVGSIYDEKQVKSYLTELDRNNGSAGNKTAKKKRVAN